jgi:dipeptidyl aminopeptidase/acylaminoacyl peptidase
MVLMALLGTSRIVAEDATTAGRRPFWIEDLYRVVGIPEFSLAPDGKRLVYVRRQRDLPRGEQTQELWLIGADGSGPRRLAELSADVAPSAKWSPDGTRVAFVADRGKGEQIYLLPMDGGESRAITLLSTGISDLVWSPDGGRIAFTSSVYPECGADDACNKKRDVMREDGPLEAHVADRLFYRHWTHWWDGKAPHVLIVNVESGKVRDATPERKSAPVFYLWGGVSYAFSHDGQELVYQQNPEPLETAAWATNDDLYTVPLGSEDDKALPAPHGITADNEAWDGTPKYSPDGNWIAYRRQLQPGYEADAYNLVLYDRGSGRKRVLTVEFDNWVNDFVWLPDSNGLIFLAEEGGRTPLYRVDIDGSRIDPVVRDAQIDHFELSPDGGSAFAIRRAVGAPPEIYRYDLRRKDDSRRITRVNRDLEEEVDIRAAERMVVQGSGGHPVEVFLVTPHGFDPKKRYPLILNVHGGPQSQWADSFRGDWQIYPGAGYIVAFANPTGSTGYGQDFTAAISKDWGGRVFEDLMKVADALEALPYVDADRMGAMGWSYGGYMMNWFLGHTDRFRAIASMMGIFDLPSMYGTTEELWFVEWDLGGQPWDSDHYQRWNPAASVEKFKTPTLVVTGELDYRVPYTQSLQLFTALQRRGIPSRLVVFPGAGHWPGWYEMALYYTAHLDWFHEHLGGDPAPWSVHDFAANRVFDPKTGERLDRTEESGQSDRP